MPDRSDYNTFIGKNFSRPTKRFEKLPTGDTREERVLTLLGLGFSRSRAAKLAGIHEGTLAEWIQRDSKLADAASCSETTPLIGAAETVVALAPAGDFNAARFLLEHRGGEDWQKRETVRNEVDIAEVQRRAATALGELFETDESDGEYE